MKTVRAILAVLAVTGASGCAVFRDHDLDRIHCSTSMRDRGMRLPVGVEDAICQGKAVRVLDVIRMRYFNNRIDEYLELQLWVELRDHWESAWTGTVVLRKPVTAPGWAGAAKCSAPDMTLDRVLGMPEEEREKLFKTTMDIEQTPAGDSLKAAPEE